MQGLNPGMTHKLFLKLIHYISLFSAGGEHIQLFFVFLCADIENAEQRMEHVVVRFGLLCCLAHTGFVQLAVAVEPRRGPENHRDMGLLAGRNGVRRGMQENIVDLK